MSRWTETFNPGWKVNLALLAALMASALTLVKQGHEARVLFADLERAKSEARKLGADVHRLNAEREGEATNLRVDQLARQKLQMRPITPALTLPSADNSAAAPATSTASASSAPATGVQP